MQLLRNVDSSWDGSKLFVRQDLDTIQRDCTTLQAQVAAALAEITAIQQQLAAPPVIIAPNGQVNNTSKLGFLTDVSHDASLLGSGTVLNPLSVASSAWLIKDIKIPGPGFFTALGSTYGTGYSLIPGVPGVVIWPLLTIISWRLDQNGSAFALWTANGALSMRWNTGGSAAASFGAFTRSSVSGNYGGTAVAGASINWTPTIGAAAVVGQRLELVSSSAWPLTVASPLPIWLAGNIRLIYTLLPSS